jgi:hypothetical protein
MGPNRRGRSVPCLVWRRRLHEIRGLKKIMFNEMDEGECVFVMNILLDMSLMKNPTAFRFMLAAAAKNRVRRPVSLYTKLATSSGSKNYMRVQYVCLP